MPRNSLVGCLTQIRPRPRALRALRSSAGWFRQIAAQAERPHGQKEDIQDRLGCLVQTRRSTAQLRPDVSAWSLSAIRQTLRYWQDHGCGSYRENVPRRKGTTDNNAQFPEGIRPAWLPALVFRRCWELGRPLEQWASKESCRPCSRS